MSSVLEMSSRILGDDGEQGNEFVPPQTFVRESLGWMDFSETGLTFEELGQPTLWRVKIFPKQPKKMSAGGIALPEQAQGVESMLNYIGQVVALGPLAGKSEKFQNPNFGPRPDGGYDYPNDHRYFWDIKVGDWVIYGRFSGQKTEYKGVLLVTCNDDDIMEKIASPEYYKVYV